MTLDALRKSGELQSHHWTAAKWFLESAIDRKARLSIVRQCRELEATTGCYGMDAFVLLHRAVIDRENLSNDPRILGVLREALNAVHRLRTRH